MALTVGTRVVGPDQEGVETIWTVVGEGPIVAGFETGHMTTMGIVTWLRAEGKQDISVTVDGFDSRPDEEPPPYRIL